MRTLLTTFLVALAFTIQAQPRWPLSQNGTTNHLADADLVGVSVRPNSASEKMLGITKANLIADLGVGPTNGVNGQQSTNIANALIAQSNVLFQIQASNYARAIIVSSNLASKAEVQNPMLSTITFTNAVNNGFRIFTQLSEFEPGITNFTLMIQSLPPQQGPGGGDGWIVFTNNLGKIGGWVPSGLAYFPSGHKDSGTYLVHIVSSRLIVGDTNDFIVFSAGNGGGGTLGTGLEQFRITSDGLFEYIDSNLDITNRLFDTVHYRINEDLQFTNCGPVEATVTTSTNGYFLPPTSMTAADVTARLVEGGGWVGRLSNATQTAWMSNSIVLWKKLAP